MTEESHLFQEKDQNYRSELDIDNYNIFSRIFLLWLSPLVAKGYKRRLEPNDLWYLRKNEEAKTLNIKFWRIFNELKENYGSNVKSGKILWEVGFIAYGTNLFFAFVLHILAVVFTFSGPFLLNRIVSYIESENSDISQTEAYLYALALGLFQVFATLLNAYANSICYSVALKFRSMLTSAVFDKVLSLDSEAKQKTTQGQIVTLISSDANFVVELTNRWNRTLSAPLVLIGGIVYIYNIIGVATFAGLGVLCIVIPMTIMFGAIQVKLQKKKLKFTDSRLSFVKEILQGIKIVKFYAWELAALTKLENIRKQETQQLLKVGYMKALSLPVALVVPNIASVSAFTTYLLLEDGISAAEAFTVVSLFTLIRGPFVTLPLAISMFSQAIVSFRRIGTFLLLSTLSPSESTTTSSQTFPDLFLKLKNATFKWPTPEKSEDKSIESFSLKGVDLEIKKGELVAIVGRVGSGKSSLCSAILEEMPFQQSKESVFYKENVSIAYCEQEAFVINETLKNNVLFNNSLDEQWYRTVISKSCLKDDLEIFPAGDMTEIGERGVTLSGGQKARVSLARALYSKAQVYVFDNILAAVDAQVSKQLFENIISNDSNSVLHAKTRIFVTNQVQYLSQVDRIVVLEKGLIVQNGKYEDLIKESNGALSKLVEDIISKEEEKEKEEEENGVIERIERKVSSIKVKAFQSSQKENIAKGKLTKIEARAKGNVKWKVLKSYWLAGTNGSCTLAFLLIGLYFFCEAVFLFIDSWLAIWTEADNSAEGTSITVEQFIAIYWAIVIFYLFIILFRSLVFVKFGVIAAKTLYTKLNRRVLILPMNFFWSTPLGTIVNRLSQDTFEIDELLPQLWQWLIMTVVRVIGSLIFIGITSPIFFVVVLPVIGVYLLMRNYYRSTSTELQRIEAITRSPLLNQLGESFSGVTTLRAYRKLEIWNSTARRKIEHAHRAKFAMEIARIWLQERLELLGAFIILSAALSMVISSSFTTVKSGLAGLSLSQALNITVNLSFSVVMATQVEARLNTVERVIEYSEEPGEDIDLSKNQKPVDWLKRGKIEFKGVYFRYREDLEPALKNASLSIEAGETVGLVGRTGAGKSTIMVALFRIIDVYKGQILIDDIDIKSISKSDVRRALTLIPQDPVLFVGTMRYNLDPFNQYSDLELEKAIAKAHLKETIDNLDGGLEAEISENGANLSVGQRALVCLARALLRKSKVVLLDEATASVDSTTDKQIQQTIRETFKKDVTLIVIAHRLQTIIDSDKIAVLSEGRIVETGHPHELLNLSEFIENGSVYVENKQQSSSQFADLVSHTGAQNEQRLRELAKQAYDRSKSIANA